MISRITTILSISIFIASAVSADTHIPAGDVYGTWTISGSPYLIDGNITIPSDSTLTIQPGVDVIFQGWYNLVVNGYLQAIGTETDSIHFTTADTAEGWCGIQFDTAPDSSILSYCLIVKAFYDYGGIYCFESNPRISNCIVSHNRPYGIWCNNSNPIIAQCTITDNFEFAGAGIMCHYSSPTIVNCLVSRNYGGSGGGGIVCDDYSDPFISHCTISDNGGHPSGGGIDCLSYSSPTIEYCLISGNSGAAGGGIYCAHHSNVVIDHCTITNNIGYPNSGAGGITIWYANSAIITNTIVEGNTGNGGIRIYNSSNVSITYCDVNGNQNGSFTGEVPAGLGEQVMVNANGDSCDIFYNIFEYPLFVDPPTGNYHLQAGSPCIDAGDPNSPLDPDGTVTDIGAYFFDQSWINDPHEILQPTEFRLYQNYPNPFNPTTIIGFAIPYAAHTTLKVFDITGRQVTTLVNGWRTPGIHKVTFDGSNLATGLYFARLKCKNYTQTQKMLLLK